jgi:hypothetical protein
MNGCQYAQSSFTLPAGPAKISQLMWDLAFMPREEFMKKYMVSSKEYARIAKE